MARRDPDVRCFFLTALVENRQALTNPRHSIDQALRFDLSDTRDDGEELWFQFTRARAERLELLGFHEEALFGLLQSWPPNRSTEIWPAQEGKGKAKAKGKGKEKQKNEGFVNPLETCVLRQHDRALTAFFRPAPRRRLDSPRCPNLVALAQYLCLECDIEDVDPDHVFLISEVLCLLGHPAIASDLITRANRAKAHCPKKVSTFDTNALHKQLITQLQQPSSPDAVLKLRSSPAKGGTKTGVYRKPVRVQRLKGRYALVTNRAVKAGDCLLYERAMVCCQGQNSLSADAKSAMEGLMWLPIAHQRLISFLLFYVFHSPSSAAQLAKFSLDKTGEPTVDPRLILDGRPVVDRYVADPPTGNLAVLTLSQPVS